MTAVVELAKPRKLMPRWLGHGDLTIAVQDGAVYLRAEQVERLAGIAPWSTGETLIEDSWPAVIDGQPYYELDVAIARCEMAETETAGAFLTWLRAELEQLLTDDVLDAAQRIPSFIGSYSVARAARILDRDPAITIGRQGLFAFMRNQGWIVRTWSENPDWPEWHIDTLARRNGWLTVRSVPVATGAHAKRLYPQVYVTPAGLEQLRADLNALHRHAPPDDPVQPSLFD